MQKFGNIILAERTKKSKKNEKTNQREINKNEI